MQKESFLKLVEERQQPKEAPKLPNWLKGLEDPAKPSKPAPAPVQSKPAPVKAAPVKVAPAKVVPMAKKSATKKPAAKTKTASKPSRKAA
jgi:hypothetical protein